MASQPAPLTSNIALYKKLNFDPAAFETRGGDVEVPERALGARNFPAKTAQEFLAYAKGQSRQAQLRVARDRYHSHLTARAVHVGHRHQDDACAVSRHRARHSMISSPATSTSSSWNCPRAEAARGGKARILAVATAKRLDMLKEAPTLSNSACRISSPTPGTRSARRRRHPPRSSPSSTGRSTISLTISDTKKRFAELNLLARRRTPPRCASW